MAFLPIEQQNTQAPQGNTSAGTPPPQTGGSGGGGTAPAKTSATGTPTQFGSSASKLGDYLSANAPQIQNQANQVVSGLNQQYGQVGQDITNAANQFGQSVSQGYAAPNQEVVNQATSNPSGFVSDPNNVKAFQAQYNDQYTGPQNFESTTPYAGIQNEVSNAVQNAGLLNTTPGLQSYFQQQGGPNRTQASNTLDALLLQGNPQAQQSIQNAAGQFQNLTPQFQQAVTGANALVSPAQQAAQQAQQYAQTQLGQTGTAFNQNLQDLLNTSAGQTQAYNAAIPKYNSDQQQLNQLAQGWNNWNAFNSNFGVNPVNIAVPTAQNLQAVNAPTLNQIASPEQLAEQQALNQLAGSNQYSLLNPNTQVGGYTPPGAIPNSNATAEQLWNELTPAYNQTMTQNINPLAQKNFDQYNILKDALNKEYGGLQTQLQGFDPTLGMLQPR